MRRTALVAALLATAAQLPASETTSLSYDSQGRLVTLDYSGAVNAGARASYSFDNSNNRLTKTVAGGSSAPPSFSVSGASIAEGGTLVFTVARSGSASSAVSVAFATADGTAVSGSDYTASSGTLSFASGETSKTVSVATIDDASPESPETVLLNLSNPSAGTTIATGQATGTITDNDSAPTPPSFAVSDVTVTEGGTLVFTITKTGTTSSSYTVNYSTANGTALAASDFTAVSGTLTFAATDSSKTVSVSTIDDASSEGTETMELDLSGPSGGATISDGTGIGTIGDNDAAPAAPSFSINDAAATEGGAVTFTVTKTGATTGTFSVNYATSIGTAGALDFTAASGTLTFLPSETTKTVSIVTRSDIRVESDETFFLDLSGPTGGATLSDSRGVGTIYDDGNGGDPTCGGRPC
jgi:hypothetical protein